MHQEHQSSPIEMPKVSSTTATQTTIHEEAATQADVVGRATPTVAPNPVDEPPMSKQAQRLQRLAKYAVAHGKMEMSASAMVNSKSAARYCCAFEIRFDNLDDVTPETLVESCTNGSVYIIPNDPEQRPELKKLRTTGSGINLSTVMTRVNRPKNIDDTTWEFLSEAWEHVAIVLEADCISPMRVAITSSLAAHGIGAVKISKKLGGGVIRQVRDDHREMCKALDTLSSLLDALPKEA